MKLHTPRSIKLGEEVFEVSWPSKTPTGWEFRVDQSVTARIAVAMHRQKINFAFRDMADGTTFFHGVKEES